MTNSYYECHLTVSSGQRDLEFDVITSGWKFSSIDGDPVEGRGVRHYATRHYKSSLPVETVVERTHLLADQLQELGHVVTRRKVEHVIFDTRSSKVRPCDGGCPECHLDDRCGNSRGNYTTDVLGIRWSPAARALRDGLFVGIAGTLLLAWLLS